jgi:hypothetical protein
MDETPTQKQLSYAEDLGLDVPEGSTKSEASDILSAHLDDDSIASDRDRTLAEFYKIEHTKYTGRASLYGRILHGLHESGREKELVGWFAYCVYCDLTDAVIRRPDNMVFKSIADDLSLEKPILDSIKRYSGKDILNFGEWTDHDGFTHVGGSKRTIAYKRVSSLLKESLSLKKKIRSKPKPRSASKSAVAYKDKKAGPSIRDYIIVAIVVIILWKVFF